jgi:uncharacterized Zn-finger protein
MLITMSMAELPGVIGVDGLKLHCAPVGNPFVHARVTAPVKDEPTGCTTSAYDPVVWPAFTVWLEVDEVTTKSCPSVSANVIEWLGIPLVS